MIVLYVALGGAYLAAERSEEERSGSKNRARARAGSVCFVGAMLQHISHHIKVLFHDSNVMVELLFARGRRIIWLF